METKRKGINSKAKGSEFELKTAKILSSWWGEEFHRTPMSGGLHWKADNRVAGDIVTPPDSVFPFSVECKKREGWTFDQVLKGTGEVESWWSQCLADAEGVGLKPMLIFAKNFAPINVMIAAKDYFQIAESRNNKMPINCFIISIKGKEPRVAMLFQDFLDVVSKSDIYKALIDPTSV